MVLRLIDVVVALQRPLSAQLEFHDMGGGEGGSRREDENILREIIFSCLEN